MDFVPQEDFYQRVTVTNSLRDLIDLLSNQAAKIDDAGEIALCPCQIFSVNCSRSFDDRISDKILDVSAELDQRVFDFGGI